MGSLYLHALSPEARKDLEKTLLSTQNGKCFICERSIDPALHAGQIDIDHVEPIKVGGKDDPSNFAITHSSCNRTKQTSDLRVARVLARFDTIRDEVASQNGVLTSVMCSAITKGRNSSSPWWLMEMRSGFPFQTSGTIKSSDCLFIRMT